MSPVIIMFGVIIGAVVLYSLVEAIAPQALYRGDERVLYKKLKQMRWVVDSKGIANNETTLHSILTRLTSADGKFIIGMIPSSEEKRADTWKMLRVIDAEKYKYETLFSIRSPSNPMELVAKKIIAKHEENERISEYKREKKEFKENLLKI